MCLDSGEYLYSSNPRESTLGWGRMDPVDSHTRTLVSSLVNDPRRTHRDCKDYPLRVDRNDPYGSVPGLVPGLFWFTVLTIPV